MPQAVDVVGQAEQQGLADLRGQAAPGCARRELSFDSGEDAFDLGALPIRFFRKSAEHLIPDSAVRDTPTSRGDNALGSQALPNMFVVGFGIKLRIRSTMPIGAPRAATSSNPGKERTSHPRA